LEGPGDACEVVGVEVAIGVEVAQPGARAVGHAHPGEPLDVDVAGDLAGVAGAFEQVLYAQNTQFNAGADVNGDGLIDWDDLLGMEAVLVAGGADGATLQAYHNVLTRRGDVTEDGNTDAADIDALFAAINGGSAAWLTDINSDGLATQTDADTLVTTIFGTFFGDASLDGSVGTADLAILAGSFNSTGNGWADGDFNGDGSVGTADLAILAGSFGSQAVPVTAASAAVPEPATLALLGLGGWPLLRRVARCSA
ncbi:MAG: PEP-CTERM sorting domain-containing protein, partial [Planctomycetota bacterium]